MADCQRKLLCGQVKGPRSAGRPRTVCHNGETRLERQDLHRTYLESGYFVDLQLSNDGMHMHIALDRYLRNELYSRVNQTCRCSLKYYIHDTICVIRDIVKSIDAVNRISFDALIKGVAVEGCRI